MVGIWAPVLSLKEVGSVILIDRGGSDCREAKGCRNPRVYVSFRVDSAGYKEKKIGLGRALYFPLLCRARLPDKEISCIEYLGGGRTLH